jgi:hypothetical protein
LSSDGAIKRWELLIAPPEQTAGMTADAGPWPLLAGLMFTAYAFTMAWRFYSRHRRPRR